MPVALVPIAQDRWDLVADWLATPIARATWYEGPAENMRWLHHLGTHKPGAILVIEADGAPVGLIVWDTIDPEPRPLLDLLAPGTRDLDILIPEAKHRGRGIGRAALALLEEDLWADPACPMLSAFSLASNAAGRRFFENQGFSAADTAPDRHYGDVTLYLKERPA